MRDAAGVVAHADTAPAAGSVLNRVPVANDGLEEFLTAGFGLGGACRWKTLSGNRLGVGAETQRREIFSLPLLSAKGVPFGLNW